MNKTDIIRGNTKEDAIENFYKMDRRRTHRGNIISVDKYPAGFGGIGISIAFLMQALEDEGYLTDAMIGGGTTVQVAMFWVAFVCILVGGAVSMAISKKK